MGVAITPDRKERAFKRGRRCTYMAFMRADCKWPMRSSTPRRKQRRRFYMYIFRPAMIALCLGPWRAVRSRRATAQMRGEFPQIDRICVTIVGIGTAKII